MLKVVIIDDEVLSVEELDYVLSKDVDVEVIGKYIDVMEAIKFIKMANVDAVFLDISMPGMNGFLVADQIREINKNIKIVFVTAYDKFATKAFEINAKDYILKPFSQHRINLTLERLKESENKIKSSFVKKIKKIPIEKEGSLKLVNTDDILFCYLKEGVVYIVTEQKTYNSDETLAEISKRVEEYNFIRCHRNYIVNLDCVINIVPWVNSTYLLKMKNCKEDIPVSRNYSKVVKKIFNL